MKKRKNLSSLIMYREASGSDAGSANGGAASGLFRASRASFTAGSNMVTAQFNNLPKRRTLQTLWIVCQALIFPYFICSCAASGGQVRGAEFACRLVLFYRRVPTHARMLTLAGLPVPLPCYVFSDRLLKHRPLTLFRSVSHSRRSLRTHFHYSHNIIFDHHIFHYSQHISNADHLTRRSPAR